MSTPPNPAAPLICQAADALHTASQTLDNAQGPLLGLCAYHAQSKSGQMSEAAIKTLRRIRHDIDTLAISLLESL